MKKFDKKVWLSSPTVYGDELKYVEAACRSNWLSTVGENIDEIERVMCGQVGCHHGVALSCGTAALHLAVKLAGVKPGDTVFCSDLTFAASVNPIFYEGGTPIFIDSEYGTWNMDPEALKKAFELYPNTKVVILVNLYGTPARLDEISAIVESHGAILIEDAAESLGAVYRGRQTGSFGTYNAISFNGNKIITGSSGGMLLSNDQKAIQTARKWSTQSREDAPWYQHEQVGYNYRMSNLIAGVIRSQYPRLGAHIARKKEIYERYCEGLRDLPVTMNPYDPATMEPNFWLSCMLINEDAMCEHVRGDKTESYTTAPGKSCPAEILEKLERYNAEGRPIWKPMHLQPIYSDAPFVSKDGVVSVGAGDDIFRRGLCLPSDNKMTNEEQDRVIEIIKSCFDA